MRRQRTTRGFTLIEVMVAMGLVALATLALLSANTFAARSSSRSYRRYIAMRLAQQRLDTLMLGDSKLRLVSTAATNTMDVDPVPDGVPQDCTESGAPPQLCDSSKPDQVGWVDLYGRPCNRTVGAAGYQPTCLFRRYISYIYTPKPPTEGDVWNIRITVSHAPDGKCTKPREGDSQCVVTSATLTR